MKNPMTPALRRSFVWSALFVTALAGVSLVLGGPLGWSFLIGGVLWSTFLILFWPSNPALKAAEERKELTGG
jgi:hypothetical protein